MSVSPLDRLAGRASDDPYFLGFWLATFAAREGLDDEALAAHLGCDVSVLAQLRVCRAPRLDPPPAFREDVTRVATEFGLNVQALAASAKPVPAAPVRAAGETEPAPTVLAARDRSDVP